MNSWSCIACTFSNHATLSTCELCDTALPSSSNSFSCPSKSVNKRSPADTRASGYGSDSSSDDLLYSLPYSITSHPKRPAPSTTTTTTATSQSSTFVLRFDGGARGNGKTGGGGGAGSGAYIMHCGDHTGHHTGEHAGDLMFSGGTYLGATSDKFTNNYAEYSGLILGLKHMVLLLALPSRPHHVTLSVLGDSQLVLKQVQKEYRCESENLRPLFAESRRLIESIQAVLPGGERGITYRYTLRGDNKEADRLANKSMDMKKSFVDFQFEGFDGQSTSKKKIKPTPTPTPTSTFGTDIRKSPFHPPPPLQPISDPGSLLVPDLLPKIAPHLEPTTHFLCHDAVPLIVQQDNFSCGYRNFQMFVCALLHTSPVTFTRITLPLSDPGRIPSLLELQHGIAAAWKRGYDVDGREHYKNRIVGTRAFVGTHEFNTLLRSLRIKSNVRRFDSCGDEDSNCADAAHALLDYAEEYFSTPNRSCVYLQYHPHSVTVVGVRKASEWFERALLVFDPKANKKQAEKSATKAMSTWTHKFLSGKKKFEVLELIGEDKIDEGMVENSKQTLLDLE